MKLENEVKTFRTLIYSITIYTSETSTRRLKEEQLEKITHTFITKRGITSCTT